MAVVVPPVVHRVLDEGCGATCVEVATADALHRECFCIAVDPMAVRAQLNAVLGSSGTPVRLAEEHAHLFASLPIYIPEQTVAQMTDAVGALTKVVGTPVYMEAVLGWAPAIAVHDPGSPGGILGFDFHLGPQGPRLIEINTNPGGLLLNAMLGYAQRVCCPALSMPASAANAADSAIDALIQEWRLQRETNSDHLVAIVDEAPEQQYLFAEFVLFKQGLEARGFRTVICDPSELRYVDGALLHGGHRVGFVYNRLTDFALQSSSLQALRQAYLDGAVALSPHPRAHAQWADKRNLALLCQPEFLARIGLPQDVLKLLNEIVPPTELLTPENRERLWATRRQWFFKPASGFGSRASYRGDKITHKTWEQMGSQPYVAQSIVPPSQRHTAPDTPPLKVDVRCYAYLGKVLLIAARLYQGQTTNFRTPGGGFAPVLTLAPE